MYLFILESIGASELILIGIVALIVFGPRKLPQMAKTIGKTMADFRRTTHEFKSTWEKEAEFYKEENIIDTKIVSTVERDDETGITIAETTVEKKLQINSPQIKEMDESQIEQAFSSIKNQDPAVNKSENNERESVGKRDWL